MKLSLTESNNEMINLITKNKPFFVARIGMGEIFCSYYYEKHNFKLNKKDIYLIEKVGDNLHNLIINTGIYIDKDEDAETFCKKYIEAISNADVLAKMHFDWIYEPQNYFLEKYKLKNIHSRILEPFYCSLEGIKPWSHYLVDKTVLIINPFTITMKKQIKKGFKIFKDAEKHIFLSGQKIKFYKSFNTIANNRIHKNWIETYNIMCNDISKIDFDIALLGCGGYGLPLCNFIKINLQKSAIYVGGGLQLLFGIMGKRWENISMWKQIIKENNTKFVRPSKDEKIKNQQLIENECYW